MAAIGQWQPPWLGCVFLPSFHLANSVSDVPQLQNHPKTNHCPMHIFINNGRMGMFQVPILCACMVGRHMSPAVPGEALETMVKLCFWPSIDLVRKLGIYCNYTWYILRTMDFYGYKEGKNVKPTVIPSKIHSAAVFISREGSDS